MVSLTRNEFDILLVTFSWLLGFAPLFIWHTRSALGRPPTWRPPTWVQCVGLALVMSPFVRMGIGLSLTFENLFTFTVLEPAPRAAIWRAVWRDVLYDFFIPVIGLAIWSNALPKWLASRRAARTPVAGMLHENGLAPRFSWARDATNGFALFVFIAAAYVGAFVLSKTVFADLSANGDETQYWRNITILLIVLRSGMAGLTEELLFRGFLMKRLSKWMPFAAAAVLQAVFFALIHAGYGTWSHLVGPFVFGLGMAWVARHLGVLVTALLHAMVNIVYFAFDVAAYVPGAWALLGVLLALNVAAAIATRMEPARILLRSLAKPFRRDATSDVDEARLG